jgi:hypothetical protein
MAVSVCVKMGWTLLLQCWGVYVLCAEGNALEGCEASLWV